ncbi:organic cation transporter protein-like [Antedon mediterranea]|uniref:organic cation transporter protein-like n=1 Tax=Antedon mediterranea TaxID=105859 RepID=UPI003AF78B62
MKFDDVFVYIGEYGRYQKLLSLLMCALVVSNTFSNISTVFISGTMDHHCKPPDEANCSELYLGDCWNTNGSMSLPPDDKGTLLVNETKCRMYADDNKTETTTCKYGWTYDRLIFESTIVSEFDLVCEDSYKVTLSQSMYLGGFFFGSLLFGFMCDYFGRKKTTFLSFFLLLLMGVLTGLSTSYWFYAICRFIAGAADIGLAIVNFTYLNELVAPSERAKVSAIFGCYWCFAIMILSVIAFFIRAWDTLLLVVSIILSPFLLLYLFVPESARWLLVNGQVEEAKRVIRQIAKGNNAKDVPDEILDNLDVNDSEKIKTNPLDIIRYPEMRKKTACMTYCWFAVNLGYYGLTYGVEGLNVDVYLGTFVGGVTELLSNLCGWYFLQRFGRRNSLAGSLVSGGLACFVNIWIPLELIAVRTTIAMIGKFFITAAFMVVYVYTAELFPTSIRTTGLGFCSFWSRVAAVLAPQVIFLEKVWKALPLVAFSFTAASSGVLSLLLPETLNVPLPQTIQEAELFTRKTHRQMNGVKKDTTIQQDQS